MARDVFITASGAFFPNEAIENGAIASRIGLLDKKSARLGQFVLRMNGIRTRHYALDESGVPTHSNAEIAGRAVMAALEDAGASVEDVDLLATATTQGDMLVPGHASAVHGEIGGRPIEIASFQSVCASSMMALRAAWLGVKADEKSLAVAVGSETAGKWFRADFYRGALTSFDSASDRMSAEFLRWTLSDGGGALLLEPQPRGPVSLRIERMHTVSFANQFAACMYAGAAVGHQADLKQAWASHSSISEAFDAGATILLQDMHLLKDIFRAWVDEYARLAADGWFDPAKIDWVLCHYSAESLREEIIAMMAERNALVDPSKWFSNLTSRGNTGSAATFIMMEEFMKSDRPRSGDRLLCIVPESGRALISFVLLEVV